MSKREHGASDVDGSRTKRHRGITGTSSDIDMTPSDPMLSGGEASEQGGTAMQDVVKEEGLRMWQTVRDAVNKEGRTLSLDFLRRPSKRLYPDYYKLIQRPIALEEIKKQLEHGAYPSLEAVKSDFELCFHNAKQYNMKDSEIWRDAKDLLKLVNKTYSKLFPADEDGENAEGDEGKGKAKAPNLTRLIKSRLQKLVDKTDETGRVLSTEFMELPSKKDWPTYYQEIKRPQCLENIFKHIKRKEYHTSGEFAADVELVFSNAMSFNQDHTPIWEDARILRDHFRVLMSDLPSTYALPEYMRPTNGKIRIKPPVAPSSTHPHIDQPSTDQSTSLLLRVPANIASHTKVSPATTPVAATVSLPTASTSTPPATIPLPLVTQAKLPSVAASAQPLPLSHYPNASYIPPVSNPIIPASSSNVPGTSQAHSSSNSPAPSSLHPSHQLKSMSLKTEPHGRTFILDHHDGVKTWAMRLRSGETDVHVGQVTFIGDEEEESSGEEEGHELEEKQEQEEEHMDVDAPAKNGRRKGKGKGKNRAKLIKTTVAKARSMPQKKKKQKIGQLQLKLNGSVIKDEEEDGNWVVQLSVGSNVLEVGETGGLIWKVYVERLSEV